MGDDENDLTPSDALSVGPLPVPDDLPEVLPGRVRVTAEVGDSTVRVHSTSAGILLTVAGADGMVTARLSADDAELIRDMLAAGQNDVRRMRRGGL